MSRGLAVGNDVVDLRDPRTQDKAGSTRFLERVLHEDEQMAVRTAPDPNGALWVRWAGKEAAYKVVSKLRGEPPLFVHRDFLVTEDSVEHEGVTYPLHVRRYGPALHALCCSGPRLREVRTGLERLDRPGAPWSAPLDVLLARFSAREADPIHSLASAAVRLGARAALALELEVDEARLEIVCAPGVTGRRPPRALLDGEPAPADVSLSHHGNWISWAILLTSPGVGS